MCAEKVRSANSDETKVRLQVRVDVKWQRTYGRENEYSIWVHTPDSVGATPTSATIVIVGYGNQARNGKRERNDDAPVRWANNRAIRQL